VKKVRTSIAMLGYPSCSVLELDDDDAASLIAGGFAEPSSEPAENTGTRSARPMTKSAPEPVVETADAPAAAETADAPAATPARKAPARKPRKSTSS
jgi:hypothetical protein